MTTMREVLLELCELLNEQKDILGKLLELSREEQGILISYDVDKLEAVVRLELKELSKLGAVEKKRAALNKVLSAELNLAGSDITISIVADNAEPDERDLLRKLQAELLAVLDEHTQINSQNRELVNSHMEYSETMLEMLSEPEDPLNNLYGGDGKRASARKKTSSFYSGHA